MNLARLENKQKKECIEDFNCANYAIGIEERKPWLNLADDYNGFNEDVASYGLHEINNINEAPPNTYVIAYKEVQDTKYIKGDFHWIVRKLDNKWYHKRGESKISKFIANPLAPWKYSKKTFYDKNERIYYQYKEQRKLLGYEIREI